jgi:hypothetical protein
MSKKKLLRTDADCKKAATDIAFEFKMFRLGLRRLDASSPSLGNNNSAAYLPLSVTSPSIPMAPFPTSNSNLPAMQNTSDTGGFDNIEGILIHFRNLIEFFFTPKPEKGDLVLAQHYTGEPPRKAPAWAREYGRRCNELLAHLTYHRTHYRDRDEHHWPDILEKCRHMDNEITAFLSCLTTEKREWFL